MDNQDQFNKELAQFLGKKFPTQQHFIKFLEDNLKLSYSAALRRSKGEISLTFQEIILLADKLKISLDNLIQGFFEKSARFVMSAVPGNNCLDFAAYYSSVFIDPYKKIAQEVNTGKISATKAIHADLPPIFLFPYRHLTHFNIFQWLYQLYPELCKDGFVGVRLTDEILEQQDNIYEIMTSGSHETTVIFGKNIITSFVNRVDFFRKLGAISGEDIKHIRDELLEAVNALETIATTGRYPMGNPVSIYLADIDFGSNYIYIEGDNYESSVIDVYWLHTMKSCDGFAVDMHKKWGDSLKKYSTLISKVCDAGRYRFFREQREYIIKHL